MPYQNGKPLKDSVVSYCSKNCQVVAEREEEEMSQALAHGVKTLRRQHCNNAPCFFDSAMTNIHESVLAYVPGYKFSNEFILFCSSHWPLGMRGMSMCAVCGTPIRTEQPL